MSDIFPIGVCSASSARTDLPDPPADGRFAALGLHEVTINGQTRYLTADELRDPNLQQCTMPAASAAVKAAPATLSPDARISAFVDILSKGGKVQLVQELFNRGLQLEFRHGSGSFYDAKTKHIVLDADQSPAEMAQALVFESTLQQVDENKRRQEMMMGVDEYQKINYRTSGHADPALYSKFERKTREEYVTDRLETIASATAEVNSFIRAVRDNGGPAMAPLGDLRPKYVAQVNKEWDAKLAVKQKEAAASKQVQAQAAVEAEQIKKIDAGRKALADLVNTPTHSKLEADQVIDLVRGFVAQYRGAHSMLLLTNCQEGLEKLLGPFGFKTIDDVGSFGLVHARLEYALSNHERLTPAEREVLRTYPLVGPKYGISHAPTGEELSALEAQKVNTKLPDGTNFQGSRAEYREASRRNVVNHALGQLNQIRSAGPISLVGRIVDGERGAAIGALFDGAIPVAVAAKARAEVRNGVPSVNTDFRTPLQPEVKRAPAPDKSAQDLRPGRPAPVVASGTIVAGKAAPATTATVTPAQQTVVVDASAYKVDAGRDGMLRALGLDPARVRVVANAGNGEGADFQVVTVDGPRPPPRTAAGEIASRRAPPVGTVTAGAKVEVQRGAREVPAIIFAPPGDQKRMITVIEGRAYYMSTGTSTSRDEAGRPSRKEPGELYEFRGIQQQPVPQEVREKFKFDVNWLIKGGGMSDTRPQHALRDIDFPIQQTFTTPAQVNAWLQQQGIAVVDDVMGLAKQYAGQ